MLKNTTVIWKKYALFKDLQKKRMISGFTKYVISPKFSNKRSTEKNMQTIFVVKGSRLKPIKNAVSQEKKDDKR